MVATGGAKIYCEYIGRGPLLPLITGAIGDAGFYTSAADNLANGFTIVSYDRRCNSRSSGDRTTEMTVAQQACDAASIIKAMGADKAIVFGSSGGGIIGLELAAAKPEIIEFLLVHEFPVTELLPDLDAEKWRTFHDNIYTKYQHKSWQEALADFMAALVGLPNEPSELYERVKGNMDFFFKYEYRIFVRYVPDVERIKNNNILIVTAVGKDSNDAYYVQSTRALAKLGCEIIEFPGHHGASLYMPEEFAKAI
jgi:pimeloyl-ACP methyl ester carboxylesterase